MAQSMFKCLSPVGLVVQVPDLKAGEPNTDAEGQEMIVARERKGRREGGVAGDEEKMEEG